MLNSAYYFGLLPAFILFLAFSITLAFRFGFAFLLLIVPLLVWKAHFYDPLLWIIIGYVMRYGLVWSQKKMEMTG